MLKLYAAHLENLKKSTTEALTKENCPGLIISSGIDEYYFADDRHIAFKPTPHFNHWCPSNGPDHYLIYNPSQKPILVYFSPDDYWYEHQNVEKEFWTECFELITYNQLSQAENILLNLNLNNFAFIGPKKSELNKLKLNYNSEKLCKRLDWQRSFKSEYEINCIKNANDIAAKAHLAAKDCFLNGGSEYDINLAFIESTGLCEVELPYTPIVALNEKTAILHYQNKRKLKNGDSFLIDAGAYFNFYASDITRTYINTKSTNKAANVFSQLISDLDRAQLELCSNVKPDLAYAELQVQSHQKIASILLANNVLKNCSVDEALEKSLTWTFYPHGVGHMLGIQVHDVAGKDQDPDLDQQGETSEVSSPSDHPMYRYLRNRRIMAPKNVFTIEPGIYFIDSLLKKVSTENSKYFNWELIELLKPLGGIRIEDNVLCTDSGSENLTRHFLPN